MEPGHGRYVPAGEPPKVRIRKPKTHNPTEQGIPGQQPPRKTNRGARQPPPPPEVANWGYDQYGNANADPAQSYPEHYDYDTGEHVDAHAYGYGSAHLDAAGHGYGTGEHVDAHAYGYGSAHLDAAGHGYGYDYDYDGAHADGGYDYDYGHGHAQPDADQHYGHDDAQLDAGQHYVYDGVQVDADQEYGYVAPTREGKGIVKKARNPRPVADGHGAGYENQGDGSAYNAAVVPEQRNPQKQDPPKPRKPSRLKSMEKGNHEMPLASRAHTGEPDGPGSARSRTSQEGSGSNHSSSHHRASNQMEQDRNAIAGNGRSSHPERRKKRMENAAVKSSTIPEAANALNEHLRKAGGGRQPAFQDVSMAVCDPHDRTLIMPEAAPGRGSSLDEWVKKHGNNEGKVQQDVSLIVYDDHDKSELEMFGTLLPNSKQAIRLPRVDEQQPQYQPRGPAANKNHQAVVPAVEKPQYQPARPVRRHPAGYANSPGLPNAYHDTAPAGAMQENNVDNKQALQPVSMPNAKCMACVHGVGVPLARLATRFACRQCMNGNCFTCTIL